MLSIKSIDGEAHRTLRRRGHVVTAATAVSCIRRIRLSRRRRKLQTALRAGSWTPGGRFSERAHLATSLDLRSMSVLPKSPRNSIVDGILRYSRPNIKLNLHFLYVAAAKSYATELMTYPHRRWGKLLRPNSMCFSSEFLRWSFFSIELQDVATPSRMKLWIVWFHIQSWKDI